MHIWLLQFKLENWRSIAGSINVVQLSSVSVGGLKRCPSFTGARELHFCTPCSRDSNSRAATLHLGAAPPGELLRARLLVGLGGVWTHLFSWRTTMPSTACPTCRDGRSGSHPHAGFLVQLGLPRSFLGICKLIFFEHK